MYKVIFNDNQIILSNKKTFGIKNFLYDSEVLFDLLIYLLSKSKEFIQIVIYYPNLEFLWQKFCSHFTKVQAAGGIVKNTKNQLLLIHRFEKWDLPKGKVNPGEKLDQTAIREVQEECGIKELEIVKFFKTTYHIYYLNNKYYLKFSHWYLMFYGGSKSLIPQIEEGIDEVSWKSKKEIFELLNKSYVNIKNLLMHYYSVKPYNYNK